MSGLRFVVVGEESLSVQCAEYLTERGHSIACLVTSETPLLQWAQGREIPTLAPGADLAERLQAPFDYLLSIANLKMLPAQLLERAEVGAINFHDGPLPRYAGLNAPVWALIAGEAEHGVSWHVMTAKADEGQLLVQRQFEVQPEDTALTLNARCYEVALDSFSELALLLEKKDLSGRAQDLSERTYYPRNKRPENLALLDLERPVDELCRLVRALDFGKYKNPLSWPKLASTEAVVYVGAARKLPEQGDSAPAGQVLSIDDAELVLGTGTSAIAVSQMCMDDGAPLSVEAAAQALGLSPGKSCLPASDLKDRLREVSEWTSHESFWAGRLRRHEGTAAPLTQFGSPHSGTPGPNGNDEQCLELNSLGADRSELLAGFAVWLGRMNATARVTWLSHLSNDALGSAKALFAEAVPTVLELPPELTFGELIKNAEAELQRLDRRGSYPLDLLGRTPGLQKPESELGLELNSAQPSLQGRRLVLCLSSEGSKLLYDPKVYSESTAADIVAQLGLVIYTGKEKPERAISDLPLVTPEARSLLLARFNSTVNQPGPDWPKTVHGGFEAQALKTPDRVACVFENRELSYRQLNERASQLAARLQQHGVARETLVGIHLPRCEDLLVAVLGTLKAGCAYLPLDPNYPTDRLQYMLADSKAGLVVSRADLAPQLQTDVAILAIDSESPDAALSEVEVSCEQLAYVIYTSGSTGNPKGVMLEHRHVTNFFLGMDERIPRFGDDSWLAVTSLSFDISVLELLWTLGRGFKVVLAPEDRAELSQEVTEGGLDLDFSLFYFSSDEAAQGKNKYRLLMEGARFADTHGFSAVWTPERHFAAFGGLYPNPSVTSAAVAAITDNVKIRAGSCVIPLHSPVRVAEEWAVVDNLSGGRVGISVAAGWHPNDFVLKQENFKDRKQAMLRDTEILRQLWRGESVSMDSPVGKVDVKTMPRPVQAELPIWLTAAGNVETFEMAARAGAGVLTHLLGQSLEELRGKIAAYRREWQRCGNEGKGNIVLMLHTFAGDDDNQVKEIVREPMKTYLRSALSLIAEHAWSFPAFKQVAKKGASLTDNFNSLSPEDTEALLDYSFERYYETAGLFGSPKRCLEVLREVNASGVDEVACLIDFGVDTDLVLEQLPKLDEVRRRATETPKLAQNDHSLAAQVHRHKVTHLQCTPSMGQMLLLNEGTQAALGQVRCWMLGGEALPPSLVSEIRKTTGAELLNMYGPTETTVWSCTDSVSQAPVSLGTPIANTQVYVLDEQRRLLPPGAPGELYIAGASVARGYLGRPELTAERFVSNPFAEEPHARMYRTGDRVRFDAQGKLEFMGRLDHQVKLRGHRIELGEIETALCKIDAIREAVVVVREDTPGDKRLVAYTLTRTGKSEDPQVLKQILQGVLPEAMLPSHYVHLQQFPLTPNAKVDRKALPAPQHATPDTTASFSAPTGEFESIITQAWKEILGVDQVGATDNFFEQGGHSLLVVQVHRKLAKALDVSVSITDIFRYPTARLLGEHLGGQGSNDRANETQARAAARKGAMERRGALRRARRS